MRSIRALSALSGVAFAVGLTAGCGGTEDGKTDMADLKPPASAAASKGVPKPSPPPKHGSPPRSQMPKS